ncbi:hypothetical protein QNI16_02060 [Cytophagaceae bacterium YF14B1]|uniref:Uncharacterized protein n=1 Tax=Xanthocytophaga flava TaxID=3048013 RepID=A0AAE3U3Z2_9BACT|nr:hypothetical protein [Xanthocytophaga flavus]MDJ1479249.1 hypothetical protein [Xanthocytophaga flavus]
MTIKRRIMRNWKSLILGVFTFSGYLLWVLNRIDTQSFITLLGFMTTAGFFTLQKSRNVVKEEESVNS